MAPLVWIITGTSSGFGRNLVLEALSRGDKVIATARGRSVGKLEDLKVKGADVLELDVTAPLDILKETAKKAHAIHGRIDVVVNNAGYVMAGGIEENTPEETFEQFNTNLFGAINVARAFLPYLRAQKSGTVVWFGSIGGWIGIPNVGLYCASKFATRGISETLHAEISPLGLKSICIEPGYFRTDLLASDNRVPYKSRISDYDEVLKKADDAMQAYNGKQPGDPKLGAKVVVDIVKGDGDAHGKETPLSLPIGSDGLEYVKGSCQKTLKVLEEWETVIKSTDFKN